MQIQCGFRLFIVLLASVIYNSVLLGQSIPWFALNGHDPLRTILINPAFQFEDKMKSSIQVGTILMDYANNFGYFKDQRFISLPFNISSITVPELQLKNDGSNPAIGLERDVIGYELKLNPSNSNKIFLSTQISYGGPGYIRVFKNGFTAGVISGMEFHGGVNDFPQKTTYAAYRNYREGNTIEIPLWNVLGYGYFYAGLYGAKVFNINEKGKLSVGINTKYLGGLTYMALENAEPIDKYTFGKDEDVIVSNLLLKYSYTHGSDADIRSSIIKGNGVGTDLGIYYAQKTSSKLITHFSGGISIKNLGFIKFNSSLRYGALEINEDTGINFSQIDSTKSLDQFVDSVHVILNTKPLNTYSQSLGKTIFIPAELNVLLNADISTYAGLHVFFGVPLSRISPDAIQFGFVPELKLDKVNIMVPFSYNQFTGFKLGAGINLDFLTFGTDDIRSFFKRDKLESGSIYFGVNVRKFEKIQKKKKNI